MSPGGKSSDGEPPFSSPGVGCEEEKSGVPVFPIFLKSKTQSLEQITSLECVTGVFMCVRVHGCVLGGMDIQRWRKKGSNLICHSKKPFNFLACGLDQSFEGCECVGENKHLFIERQF